MSSKRQPIRANRKRDAAYLQATLVAHTLQQGEAPGAITTSWAIAKRLWPEAVARLPTKGMWGRQHQVRIGRYPVMNAATDDMHPLATYGERDTRPVIWIYQQARPGTLTFWFPHSGTVVHDNFYTGLRASVESPL